MTELIFRTARRDDVPLIVAMLADDEFSAAREASNAGRGANAAQFGSAIPVTSGQATGGTVSEGVDAAYWAAYEAIDADPRNELIVVERDGEVIGTMQLTFIPSLSRRGAERALIEAVRVRRDLRGAGIGRRMIEWAIEVSRERGCKLVQLTTDKRRAAAHRFYAGLGFAATHEGMKLNL